MSRVAALDCGTNSLRLLIADRPDGGRGGPLVDLARRMEIVRLGQDVDRTGVLAPEALERTRLVLEEYAGAIRANGVPADPAHVRLVATSATRDAANRDEFVAIVEATLHVQPDVVSGDEEARLSFAGATRELIGDPGTPPPYLVIDIGGGSTELVLGGEVVSAASSMDVGSVRLTERRLVDDPPTDEEVAAVEADVSAALDTALVSVRVDPGATVVAVAGTATTVTALALRLERYEPGRIHHAKVPVDRLNEVADLLRHSTKAEILDMPVVHPKRADVITAGALILRTVLRRLGAAGYIASEHDILDGIAWSIPAGADGGTGQAR